VSLSGARLLNCLFGDELENGLVSGGRLSIAEIAADAEGVIQAVEVVKFDLGFPRLLRLLFQFSDPRRAGFRPGVRAPRRLRECVDRCRVGVLERLDSSILMQDVAELVDAFEQAVLGEWVHREFDLAAVR
jgi:hypothetical protein